MGAGSTAGAIDAFLGARSGLPARDAARGTPPRKRTKKAQSCDPCRRRKLKCDRGWPCGACRDRSEQHMCTWEDGVVPENAGRDAQDAALVLQKMSSVERQLERLMQRFEHVEAHLPASPARRTPDGERSAKRARDVREMDAYAVGGLFGMSWEPTPVDCMRRTLLHMLAFVPTDLAARQFISAYERDVDWMSRVLTVDEVNERLDEMNAFRARLEEDPGAVHALGRAEVTRLIYTAAMLLSVFGLSLVFSRDVGHLTKLAADHGSMSVHERFFHEAQLGLSTLNVFEEPHIDFIVCMLLLSGGMCWNRSPAVSVSVLQQAIHVAMLLDLDVEPPESMPPREAMKRVHIFYMLCVQDWFSTTTTKRYPAIQADASRLPSVFGTPEEQSKYLSPNDQYKLSLAHLYSQASVLHLHREDYAQTRQLHDETLRLKARIPQGWCESSLSEATRSIHMIIGNAALDYFLIRIHLRYYLRGWDDPTYRLSRDTCFASARRLLHVFRAAFSWKVPPKAPDAADKHSAWEGPDQVSVAARMWWFSNWGTAAALLLVKHLTILNERNETCGWDQERESIVQDLCIMSRLLQYLAPITAVAHDGYEAMQRVAAHALNETFHAPDDSDNYVAHWAARILHDRARSAGHGDGTRASAEPMSLLNNIMHSSEIIRDARADAGPSPGSKPPRDSLHSTPSLSGASSSAEPASADVSRSYVPEASDERGNAECLDTFWAQFALPTLPAGPPAPALDAPGAGPIAPLPPPVPVPHAPEWLPDLSMLDPAFGVPQREHFAPSAFNMPMDTLGPLTDDFIRMFEGYSKQVNPGAGASLSMS